MKTFEEVFKDCQIPKDLVESYSCLFDLLNQIEELTGTSAVELAEGLETDKYNEYCFLRNKVFRKIVQIVKNTKEKFDYSQFIMTWENKDFWNEIMNRVENATGLYLDFEIIRIMDSENRKKMYFDIFNVIYYEHENQEYAVENLELDKNIVTLLYKLLLFCERIIFHQNFSKRRFFAITFDGFGLEQQDLEIIWNLYENDRSKLENIVLANRLSNLEIQIAKILSKADSIKSDSELTMNSIINILKLLDDPN